MTKITAQEPSIRSVCWRTALIALLMIIFTGAAQAQLSYYQIGEFTVGVDGYTGGGDVVIPSSITADYGDLGNRPFTVVDIAPSAFAGNTAITSVTIPSTVTEIDDHAFAGCTGLTSAVFQGDAPSMGGNVFTGAASGFTVSYYYDANGFTSPTWTPDANDSYPAVNLGSTYPGLFNTTGDGNGGLTITQYTGPYGAVIIPGSIGGQTVTGVATNAFQNLRFVTSVTIPASVTNIGSGAFFMCSSLTSAIFLGNAPTMGGNVFANDANGFTVTYYNNATGFASPTWTPDANDSYATVIAYPFTTASDGNGGLVIDSYTGSLDTVIIPPSINSLPVTDISVDAFVNQTNVTSVTIPSSVTSIARVAFEGCSSLTSITIPASVTNIGNYAFNGCSSLASAVFLGNAPSMGLSVFANAANNFTVSYYLGTTGFTSPTWTDSSNNPYPAMILGTTSPAQFTTTSDGNGGLVISGYTGTGGAVVIPGTINGLTVTAIGANAFQSQASLTSVTLPPGITSLGQNAFADCSSLTSAVFLGNGPTMGGYVFASAASGFTISYYASAIGFASPTWTSDANDSYPAVNLGTTSPVEFTTASDGNGGLVITGYTGASHRVIIPGTINGLTVTSLASNVFAQNTTLTSVTLPNSVTSIPNGAFEGCVGLTSVTLSNAITSIGAQTFEGCTSLTGVTIPTGVTSIGASAFRSCGLTSVTVPASVTSLGQYAFDQCASLTSALFLGNSPIMGGYVFVGAANSFTISYYASAIGFTTPTWTSNANDSYPTVELSPGISLSGSLAFGNVTVNTTATATLTINNTGSEALTVSSISYPSGFSGAYSGSIPAGGSQDVTVTFAPIALTGYSGNITVNSNALSGTDTIAASGTGTSAADAFDGAIVGVNLKKSAWFGHYTYATYPLVYQYYLGYEYAFPTSGGVYLYDYSSGHFWYTQSSYFPFIYDFGLNTFIYYYQANTPHRHFYDFGTNTIITE